MYFLDKNLFNILYNIFKYAQSKYLLKDNNQDFSENWFSLYN